MQDSILAARDHGLGRRQTLHQRRPPGRPRSAQFYVAAVTNRGQE